MKQQQASNKQGESLTVRQKCHLSIHHSASCVPSQASFSTTLTTLFYPNYLITNLRQCNKRIKYKGDNKVYKAGTMKEITSVGEGSTPSLWGSWLEMAGYVVKLSTKCWTIGHPWRLKLTRGNRSRQFYNEDLVTRVDNYQLFTGTWEM